MLHYNPTGLPGSPDGNYFVGRWQFRNPPVDVSRPHIAVVGGTETYGRFMRWPYPVLLAPRIKLPIHNLGIVHGGLVAFEGLLDQLHEGCAPRSVVLETPNLLFQSNLYYNVHPHRNDRITRVHPLFRELFPKVNILDVNFVGHLWQRCLKFHPHEAEILLGALKDVWLDKMQSFIRACQAPVHLLHFDRHSAKHPNVTQSMLSALDPLTASTHTIPRPKSEPDYSTFQYDDWDRPLVETMLGQGPHDDAVHALTGVLSP